MDGARPEFWPQGQYGGLYTSACEDELRILKNLSGRVRGSAGYYGIH